MRRVLPVFFILLFAAMLLIFPQTASTAAAEALRLCVQAVIPSLYPFFFVTGLAVRLDLTNVLQRLFAPVMGPLFRMRGICAMPLVAGLLGGYPTGAAAIAQLHEDGLLTTREAELLLGFCNNCGPAFILGFVGSNIFSDSRAGVWLYLIHVLSALFTGILLCRLFPDRGRSALPCPLPRRLVSFPEAFTASVSAATGSMLNICGYVVLFRVIAALLPGHLPIWCCGALEMVTGLSMLSPTPTGFVLAAGFLSWGGLCVHCQTMSAARGLRLRRHWLGKAVQCALSLALAALLVQ